MIYTRLYIDKETKTILMCEADSSHNVFQRSQLCFENQQGDQLSADDVDCVVVHAVIEHNKDSNFYNDATNFIDQSEDLMGSSIFKVNDDFTVSLCPKKCKMNKGGINTVKPLSITTCEVLDSGN